jgi:hypothetical protein
MSQDLINRYQPGGDLFAIYQTRFGDAGANEIAAAAATGDESAITTTVNELTFGQPLDTSTADILANQLATDPLNAPLASASNILSKTISDLQDSIKKTVISLAENPLVAVALIAGIFIAVKIHNEKK